MPIEVKELVVRAVVVDGLEDREARLSRGDDGGGRALSGAGSEAIVEACVRQVLRVLKQKTER
jgi:hypothetical protein